MRFQQQVLMLLLVTSFLFGVNSFAARPVSAATFCVNTGGTSGCSRTIQGAIDASTNPSDIVSVSAGTYLERLQLNKPLHLIAASGGLTVIDGQGLGTIVTVSASNVEIRGFTVRNASLGGSGIYVRQANGVNITSNTISANLEGNGVNLYRSNKTLVSNNIFKSNFYAVNVTDSHSEQIIRNQAVAGNDNGVVLSLSTSSLVGNNTFSGGTVGVDISESWGNNVTRNLLKGMSTFGVLLCNGKGCLLPNSPAPHFELTQNNTVNENTFQQNQIGVDLQNSTKNVFYHNDFFSSVSRARHVDRVYAADNMNTWDNSTLSGVVVGGNYWDNYTGTDADNDGIGETLLPANGVDNYPLLVPYAPVPVLIENLTATPTNGISPLAVSFSARITGSQPPFTYTFDFGDGSPKGNSANVTHTFAKAGTFSATLTAGDAAGGSDSMTVSVIVSSPPSSPSPALPIIPIVAGVLAALVIAGGFLFWRKRRRAARPVSFKRN